MLSRAGSQAGHVALSAQTQQSNFKVSFSVIGYSGVGNCGEVKDTEMPASRNGNLVSISENSPLEIRGSPMPVSSRTISGCLKRVLDPLPKVSSLAMLCLQQLFLPATHNTSLCILANVP